MRVHRGYRFRLYPTPDQEELLRRALGVCRLVYSLALEQRRDHWREYKRQTGKMIGYTSQARELTALRAEFPWIRAVSQTMQQQALRDLDGAFQRFFRGEARYSRPRRRGETDGVRFMGREARVTTLNGTWSAAGPDRKWGGDISYIWTREGWLYLAVVLDLYSRRVVGWAAGDRLHKELALTALRRALFVRQPGPSLLHHSDRGSQYCSNEYQAELRGNGIVISMSSKGNCYDNAMVEAFFKTLKSELIWRTAFQTRAEATVALARYIDGFYNPGRRHSALGFISPTQFERGIVRQTALH